MKPLDYIFSLLVPKRNLTWLSSSFSRWNTKRLELQNDIMRKNMKDDYLFFEVQGAGDISVYKKYGGSCGTAVGFSIGVEWGRYGFVGGCIDLDEAKRLADFIIEEYNKLTDEDKQRRLDEIERAIKFRNTPISELFNNNLQQGLPSC